MIQKPLADEIRPTTLSFFVGQKHLVGKNGVVRKLIANAKRSEFFPSLIFWGPPGSGKTTLARIIAKDLKRKYFEFSAVNTSTKDIEAVTREIERKNLYQMPLREKKVVEKAPIVFIDEIHRFNKAQQDKLLPHVEKGTIVLIGATTENPSFEVIGPLLSRSRVVVLNELAEKDLRKIVKRAKEHLGKDLERQAETFLIESSNGDARVTLNVLEIAANLAINHQTLAIKDIEQALQKEQLMFDKRGEEYYNVISAFIKSMRAGSADASLYYLARMVEAGQDPLYIARRMVVFASEDVGMAQPTALVVANEVFRACEEIGYPECAINLAHGVTYLALAKKSRASYDAYSRAVEDVRAHGNLPVPIKIRNAPTKLMKDLGYGKGYYEDKYKLTTDDLLPEKLRGKKYFKE